MLCLVALGLTLTGAFGVRLLRDYLVDRVDEQLADGVRQIESRADAGAPAAAGPTCRASST